MHNIFLSLIKKQDLNASNFNKGGRFYMLWILYFSYQTVQMTIVNYLHCKCNLLRCIIVIVVLRKLQFQKMKETISMICCILNILLQSLIQTIWTASMPMSIGQVYYKRATALGASISTGSANEIIGILGCFSVCQLGPTKSHSRLQSASNVQVDGIYEEK